MRALNRALLLLVLVTAPGLALAGKKTCLTGTDPTVADDFAQITALRDALDAACACEDYDGVTKGQKRGDFKKCQKPIIKAAVDAGELRKQCQGTVKKIYALSTCALKPTKKGEKQPCVKKITKNGKVKCALKLPDKCSSKPGKFSETVCDQTPYCMDAADTNANLLLDPNDSGECATIAGCVPEPEICGDGIDQDCNGSDCVVLTVAIESPQPGGVTGADFVNVSGSSDPAAETVSANGVPGTVSAGSFSVNDVPLIEGANPITVTVEDAQGNTGTDSVTVTRDSVPPVVVISTPIDQQRIPSSTTIIAGTVNDAVIGTVDAEDCTVTVTGRTGIRDAVLRNRSFLVEDFPLVLGSNTLTAVATDTAGNISEPFAIEVVRTQPLGNTFAIVSGNLQIAPIDSALGAPVVVEAKSPSGNPLPNRALTFRVASQNGQVGPVGGPTDARSLAVLTDGSGRASVDWQLGSRVGQGNNRLLVSGLGFEYPVELFASATNGACEQLAWVAGTNQLGVVGSALARPLEVSVIDGGGNFCAGVPVTFSVERGAGNFSGNPDITVNTNADGRAAAALTLGPAAGINSNEVSTSIPNGIEPGVTFTASAVVPVPGAGTRFVGTVVDTEGVALPNVHVEIGGADTFSDEQGHFVLESVPTGRQHLHLSGATTTRLGSWPSLEFEVDIVANIDNDLGMTIFMPDLDDGAARLTGPNDVILPMTGAEGYALRIFGGSATFPDGSGVGPVSVSQVTNDRAPMAMPGPGGPAWVGTLQPPGVHFDPPAQMTVPNAEGLPPGRVVDFFSFDHDLGEFVSIGTGTVSDDGSLIVTDPGSGITKAGWHGVGGGGGGGGCGSGCPQCWKPVGAGCPTDCEPEQDGNPCSDNNQCTLNDYCMQGECVGEEVKVSNLRADTCFAAPNQVVEFQVDTNFPNFVRWSSPLGSPQSSAGSDIHLAQFPTSGEHWVIASCQNSTTTSVTIAATCEELATQPPNCAPDDDIVSLRACEVERNASDGTAGSWGRVTGVPPIAEYGSCANTAGHECMRLTTLFGRHTYDLDTSGRILLADAEDLLITNDNCIEVILDIVPRDCPVEVCQGETRPWFLTYLFPSATIVHEDFHKNEYIDLVTIPTADELAQFTASNDAEFCAPCLSFREQGQIEATFNQEMGRLWEENAADMWNGQHEKRAYAVSNAFEAQIKAGILARGVREGWTPACTGEIPLP